METGGGYGGSEDAAACFVMKLACELANSGEQKRNCIRNNTFAQMYVRSLSWPTFSPPCRHKPAELQRAQAWLATRTKSPGARLVLTAPPRRR